MCLLNVNFHLIKRGKYLSISQLLLNTNITQVSQVSIKTTTVYFPFLACLVKGIVFIDYAFGDRNLLNCYLILLSILLDNICITEYC
jgi:hypothetical protein